MNEKHVYGTKSLYPQLDNVLRFRLSSINETKDCFIVENSKGDKICKKTLKNILQHLIMLNWF